jgi:K(+)-stimulated pyrophosphate-energized sodium pump
VTGRTNVIQGLAVSLDRPLPAIVIVGGIISTGLRPLRHGDRSHHDARPPHGRRPRCLRPGDRRNGIAEMAGLPKEVRHSDALDLSNTTRR